jgi:precorrin-2 dehydrogenase / sirohydrochlorin ferrochelatase
MSAALYPLFLNLQGRTCVVIGGNEMAEGKVRDLLDAQAKIRLIAPDVTRQIAEWSRVGKLHWQPRSYQKGDLADAFLVVSIADIQTNAQAFEEAEAHHAFCNAVDDIPHCSSYASAVVRRGPLQIAISTAGKSPALAQRLRMELEERFCEEYGRWVQRLGELRSQLFQNKEIDSETRRRTLHEQASASAFESFRTQSPKDPNR